MAESKYPYNIVSERYEIIKKIASGGTSDIFFARDLKLGKDVALKILYSNYAGDKNFVIRFKSEAQILNKLNNPYIVKVYDWGNFDSSYYISMEYVEGKSLKEIIEQKGPIQPESAAKVAIQICEALEAAHKNNLIHRDIKPQNILVTRNGSIKITDFGIAKSLSADLTRTLDIVGTAHYLSPEQAQGKMLDNRTDIYSLGVVLYEMLTADVPFRGENSIDISLKHINEKPLNPGSLLPGIPEKIEKIVLHCLEKKPSNRYSDVGRLKKDFENFLENRPLTLEKEEARTFKDKSFINKLNMPLYGIILIFLTAIFLALFIIYSKLYYSQPRMENIDMSVPPVENIQSGQAAEILESLGLKLEITGEEFNKDVPQNYIISQYPENDSEIPEDMTIRVIVSSGPQAPEKISMPNLAGVEYERALEILKQSGIENIKIIEEYSDFYDKNLIISQDPAFEKEADINGSVKLTVSKGNETVTIPNIIGLDYFIVKSYLSSLELEIITHKKPPDGFVNESGLVIESIPSPGTRVPRGANIEIFICSTEELIEMPDLLNHSVESAGQLLQSLNLNFQICYVDADYSVNEGLVLEQIPARGIFISPGEDILLFVGRKTQ